MTQQLKYLSGFANEHATEALDNALPIGQNSPQKIAYNLYAEQVSGTAFTTPRSHTLRSWQYRIYPSVMHDAWHATPHPVINKEIISTAIATPEQCRWRTLPSKSDVELTDGLFLLACNGDAHHHTGNAVYLYECDQSMTQRHFMNADGEMLFVPYKGTHRFITEYGILDVEPEEIIVIPRGVVFRVEVLDGPLCGYICENFGAPFQLPELGPIGANGLANPRDFQYPTAYYEDQSGDYTLLNKYQGNLWQASMKHSPINVVAWHGNLAPYKYNLNHFNTINTVSFDHPDPSIFTVLTSPGARDGVANCDFVIFPSRWMVAENTFRPPYYHRNYMNELMGLIKGVYDAKEDGFVAGGASIHNCMSAHGPDREAFEKASNNELKPTRYRNTLAFMFESCLPWNISHAAMNADFKQSDYQLVWQSLQKHFTAP